MCKTQVDMCVCVCVCVCVGAVVGVGVGGGYVGVLVSDRLEHGALLH